MIILEKKNEEEEKRDQEEGQREQIVKGCELVGLNGRLLWRATRKLRD